MNRLMVSQNTIESLQQHFSKKGLIEDGTFYLLRQGKGILGTRFLMTEMIPSQSDSWERQGPAILRPSAKWISASISRAIQNHAGLIFIHSHPNAEFPQGLSSSDMTAFRSLSHTLAPILDGPFAAAVVHPSGWSGVFWKGGDIIPFDKISSIGSRLDFLSFLKSVNDLDLDSRQRDALGFVHDRVRHLDVAVVGCGGLGSAVAEQLVRMGVRSLILIDHDRLDTDSNLRRMIGSVMVDLKAISTPLKVDIVGRHLDQLGFGVEIRRINGDVRTEEVFRALLDVDVVLNCTDTHGSRAVVNDLASTYLLPVIDVGVRVSARYGNKLAGLIAEARILTPTTPCLWCRQTIDSNAIRLENLPLEERSQLKKEGYVAAGFGDPVPSVISLTVLGSGMATCALLRLLSEEGENAPTGYWFDGLLGDSGETKYRTSNPDCWCQKHFGLGDSAQPPFVNIISSASHENR